MPNLPSAGKTKTSGAGGGGMIEVIARGGGSPAKAAVAQLVEADGAWVPLDADHPLVTAPQTRRYWARKVGRRLEVGRDTDTKELFGRLVVP